MFARDTLDRGCNRRKMGLEWPRWRFARDTLDRSCNRQKMGLLQADMLSM